MRYAGDERMTPKQSLDHPYLNSKSKGISASNYSGINSSELIKGSYKSPSPIPSQDKSLVDDGKKSQAAASNTQKRGEGDKSGISGDTVQNTEKGGS